MSYANLTIKPVRLAHVFETTSYNKPSLTLVFLAKGSLGLQKEDKPLPVVAIVYGKTVEEKKEYFTQVTAKQNFILTGDVLLEKPDSPNFDPGLHEMLTSYSCARIPLIKMPEVIDIGENTSAYNKCLVAGSSNKAPEVMTTATGKTLAKHSFGVYSHKAQGKGVYSYFNCTIFNDNYPDLVQANSSVLINGRLGASFSQKTELWYFDVVGNTFQKIGYDAVSGGQASYPTAQAPVQLTPTPAGVGGAFDEEVPF